MAASAAGAAAAAHQRRLLEEEEEMTKYSSQELADEWEFKIVRSSTAAFKKPEALRQMLEAEAMAGWALVEKFDDNRVRLKRPRSARERDTGLPAEVDPYRTRYGPSDLKLVLIILGSIFGSILAVALVVFLISNLR